jgi:hypothetical protein
MGIEDLLGRIADALVEGNEINQKRLELCEEMLAIQKEQKSKAPRTKAAKPLKSAAVPEAAPQETSAESVAKEVAPQDAPVEPAPEAQTAQAEPSAERTFETFESLAELRAACQALLFDPEGVTDAECAAAHGVYSRYGRCLEEIPQERWGEFYHDLKKAFEEARANG